MGNLNWERARTRDRIRDITRADREAAQRQHARRYSPNKSNAGRRAELKRVFGTAGVEHAARLVERLATYDGTDKFLKSLQGQARAFSSELWCPSARQYVRLAKALGEAPVQRVGRLPGGDKTARGPRQWRRHDHPAATQ
jgi:hypothetical protein